MITYQIHLLGIFSIKNLKFTQSNFRRNSNHTFFHLHITGSLAGFPAVHAGHRAGAAHPDHDHRLLRHLQEAPLPVQLQRLPQQVVTLQSQQEF